MSYPALALPGPIACRPARALSRRQRRGLALLLMLALHLAVLLPLSRLRLASEAPAPVMVGVWVPTPPAPAVPLPAAAPPRAPAPPLATKAAPVLSTRTPVPAAQPTLAAAPEAAPEPAAAPSVATPPAAASGPVAENLSPPSYQAAYLNNPQPAYPLLSRKQREEGTVRLRVLVSAAGRAEQLRVHTGSGHERLDRAALAAVQEWRFVPARRGEQNVSGWVEVPIQFKLEN